MLGTVGEAGDVTSGGVGDEMVLRRVVPALQASALCPRGRHRRRSRSWLCLAERILADWPTTLRTSLLLLILIAGLAIVMVATLGLYGVVMVGALAALFWWKLLAAHGPSAALG